MSGLKSHYSAHGIESRILAGLRAAGLNPDERLTPEQLGALDHFHTGGLLASRELLEMADIRDTERVLDIGAGLAGSARFIASVKGCTVDCIEMSADYCAGANLLNKLTGMEDRIAIHQGSALELPFPDRAFDVVWMQNVGMNIADKKTLYREIARVLKPGGRYAFQEMAAGNTPTTHFPLPWATEPDDSYLIPPDAMQSLLGECGLFPAPFEDTTDLHLQRTQPGISAAPSPAGQLGLSVFVDNLGTKAANARRSLEEGQVRFVRGVFRTK